MKKENKQEMHGKFHVIFTTTSKYKVLKKIEKAEYKAVDTSTGSK